MKYLGWIAVLCWLLVGCGSLISTKTLNFASSNTVTTVPMRLLHSGEIGRLPLVKVKLGQHDGWWLLDTGASANIISQPIAEAADLRRIGSEFLSVIGGGQQQAVYQLPDMVIGDLTLGGQTAIASTDLGLFSLPEGGSITGILGMPALEQLQVKLDFPKKSLQLSQGQPFGEGSSAGVVLPMGTNLGRPVVTLAVAGLGQGEFMVDTGNSGALVMDRAAFGLEKRRPQWLTLSVNDLGGKVTTGLFLLPTLIIGDVRITSVPVSVPLSSNTDHVLRGAVASMGNALFMSGELTMDFPATTLIFTPEKHDYSMSGGFGFTLDEKSNRIHAVILGSPADLHGLKTGDMIVGIDSTDTRNLAASTIWEILTNEESVRFVISRGSKTFLVSLEKSYFLPSLIINDK